MAAALECWSNRASTDDEMVEQAVLMRTEDRSEGAAKFSSSAAESSAAVAGVKESSAMQKKLQRLSRNVSEAIASLKNSLNLDTTDTSSGMTSSKIDSCRKVVWGSVVRNLTLLYPGSQLPEKLVSNIRKHYDSLPLSYAQAGFEMKEVFLHIKLIEQAAADEQPAMLIQEATEHKAQGVVYKLTFACKSSVLRPVMCDALETASICCKKMQIFEKRGCTVGIVLLRVQAGQEKLFRNRVEIALKSAIKKPKQNSVKLAFGLCGCQEESTKGREVGEMEEDIGEQNYRNGTEISSQKIQLPKPLHPTSVVVSVDEWQTVQSGRDEIGKWLLNSDNLDFVDQIGPNSFKGVYKGKKVGIEKLKGCDKGNSYDFELQRDLLELMTFGNKNILQFYGVCIDDNHGLCIVTKLIEGGSVYDMMLKSKKIQTKDVVRIAVDVAEGIKFMNDHGVAYRDLNTQRILIDRNGNACLGDLGVVSACKGVGDATDYEMDGYRWLAPEIIAGDPECVSETWMSNAYSFGMVIWEMVTGEAAYAACSPVQAAVGIAACGLRPDIPKDCPQMLRFLMSKCWNNTPSKRPQFSEILSILHRTNNNLR